MSAPSPARASMPALTLHRGRLAAAVVGAVALLAVVVTLVLGAVGLVSFLVPVACLAVAGGSVALLRVLAIRGRHARVQQAFAHAMAPVRRAEAVPREAPVAAPQRPTRLFDADASVARPLTAMELRTAALAVAHGSSAVFTGRAPEQVTESVRPAGSTTWVPAELPRPTYVDAAKAEREAPAPLDLPEAPRPSTTTSIRTSEAVARAASRGDADRATVSSSSTAPATGRINLDDVLQRRRA